MEIMCSLCVCLSVSQTAGPPAHIIRACLWTYGPLAVAKIHGFRIKLFDSRLCSIAELSPVPPLKQLLHLTLKSVRGHESS